MPCGGQARGIFEFRAAQAQPFGFLIHGAHKLPLVASHTQGERRNGVIAGCNGSAGEQLPDRHALPVAEVHGRAAHGGRGRSDADFFVKAQPFGADGIHGQEHGHHLGERRRRDGHIGIFFKKHLARIHVDQNGRAHAPGCKGFRCSCKQSGAYGAKKNAEYRHAAQAVHSCRFKPSTAGFVVLL